ncbi:MoxR-like ATPase [Amycolatopsis deserti]|uniref:MoxR-like ATPase n=1 Tax=Amycolatopsis deserti TaxID=185696 RepID=A0ABQ3IRW3_9PSEU|nr:MoxR family ATPase [Amycolatopsis deserti]GHE87489.1 MoxR-like ATPase [Amycolatopsis deserti]
MTSRTQPASSGEFTGEQAPGQAPYHPSGASPAHGLPISHNGHGELHETMRRIAGNVERVLVGKPEVVRVALVTLLAEGHLLVEDVPGVGKTSLAKALARSIDCTVSRIQFTPDLLPSDVTGVSIYNRQTGGFEFRPGPVFANIVVGDEINRASPKTQSALLECMEEKQVTVDTTTYRLDDPFMVIATQNPIEMEGTYALPEAQRDRFTARVSIGYPDQQAELAMVDEHSGHDPLADLQPVSDAATLNRLIQQVRTVHIAPEVRKYAVDLVAATRQVPEIRLGASPRATLQLVRSARAQAALSGRDFVVPDDLHAVAVPVLAHRLVLTTEAHAARRSATDVVRAVLHRVPVPQGGHPQTAGRR